MCCAAIYVDVELLLMHLSKRYGEKNRGLSYFFSLSTFTNHDCWQCVVILVFFAPHSDAVVNVISVIIVIVSKEIHKNLQNIQIWAANLTFSPFM